MEVECTAVATLALRPASSAWIYTGRAIYLNPECLPQMVLLLAL